MEGGRSGDRVQIAGVDMNALKQSVGLFNQQPARGVQLGIGRQCMWPQQLARIAVHVHRLARKQVHAPAGKRTLPAMVPAATMPHPRPIPPHTNASLHPLTQPLVPSARLGREQVLEGEVLAGRQLEARGAEEGGLPLPHAQPRLARLVGVQALEACGGWGQGAGPVVTTSKQEGRPGS